MRRAWLLLALASTAPAQLVTTDAGVISPALVILKERFEWTAREEADELRAITSVSFAPERRLQLDLAVPYAHRRVDFGTLRGDQDGLGDIEFGAKWALIRDDDVMRSDRLSVLGNLRLPTGEDDTRVDGVDLGPRAGLGLGTFGGALGISYTLVRDQHRAAIALRGWTWATDDGFAPGDAVTLDTAWWIRLSPRQFTPGLDEVEWRGVLEVLGRWQADDEVGGLDANNGGTEWTFVAGLQANVQNLSFEVGGLIPLEDSTSPTYGELQYGLLFSFRIFF